MEEFAQGTGGGVISLLFGHPDPSTLMTAEFQNAVQTVVAQPGAYRTLQYGNEQGVVSLIRFLVEKLNRDENLSLTDENVMITAGSTGALDMIARLYVQPGDVVIAEGPSYMDSLQVLRDHHLELRSILMDENGVITAVLEKLLEQLHAEGKPPRFLYTIPTFQNPTGITASLERRREVIQLAQRYDLLIVEDDVYRDLAFAGDIPPSYYALTGGQQVISIGSFSKILAPGLRLGWMVASPDKIQAGVNCGMSGMGGGANPFTAQIVAEYCRAGHLESHVARLQKVYQQRCQAMLGLLEAYMPPGVRWTHPGGGFFLWIFLPESVDGREVKQKAFERGVTLAAGSGFFVNPADGTHNLRLAFSYASPDDMRKAIQILAEVIASL